MKRNRRPRKKGKASIVRSFSEGLESVLRFGESELADEFRESNFTAWWERSRWWWAEKWEARQKLSAWSCKFAREEKRKTEGWGKPRGERTNVAIK